MKRPGGPAGEDFADNRVPGGDKGPEGLDQRTGIRQPVPAGTMAEAIPFVWLLSGQPFAIASNTLGGRSQRALS